MPLRGTNSTGTNDQVTVGGLAVVGIDANAVYRMPVNTTVAAAGSTVADAAQVYPGFTVVSAADGTKGIVLPATPLAGTMVYIKGTAAAVLKVWPDAAATINAISSNGAMSLASGAIPALFVATSATQWYSIGLVPA